QRGLDVPKHLDLAHAFACAVVPGVHLSFRDLRLFIARGVRGKRKSELVKFLVVARVDFAARHPGDDRGILTSLSILLLGPRRGRQQCEAKPETQNEFHVIFSAWNSSGSAGDRGGSVVSDSRRGQWAGPMRS